MSEIETIEASCVLEEGAYIVLEEAICDGFAYFSIKGTIADAVFINREDTIRLRDHLTKLIEGSN